MKISLLKQIIKEEIQKVFNEIQVQVPKTSRIIVNGKMVDPSTIEIDDIDMRDYPDFSDAHSVYAEFVDGTELTDEELEKLDDEHRDLIHELIFDKLY
jgi:hypothetical protein